MAELKIDIDAINKKVIPPINKANTELQTAIDDLYSIGLSPEYYKFYSRERIQSILPRNIDNIKSDVNNISGWIGGIATRFEEANRKSNNAINSLFSKVDKINFLNNAIKTGAAIGGASIAIAMDEKNIGTFAQAGFDLAETVITGVQNGINCVGAAVSSAWNSIYNNIVKPGVDFFEDCKAKVCNFVTGAVNEISNGVNKIVDGITSFAQAGWNKACEIAQSVGDAFNSAGAWISSTWNSFCTDVWPNIWDGIQSCAASIANVITGIIKGLAQFVESLVDLVVIIGTGVASIGTGIWDGISYLVSLATGTSDEWQSATAGMWQGVMGFVAEDHVGNAFADFYKNTEVGQWLDEHAVDACKSNGIVTNISSGIGYVAGIIVLTICTLGAGTAISGGATAMSFATTSATIATAAGTGKYTQEAWGKARDSSWEGIERLYQRGEITEKEYNTYVSIKSMTDEEWAEIQKDYKKGKITKEEFEQIKQIREMPDDWKTFENGWKGLLYGVANGVWEGVQWYIGGKLAGWAIKGHKIATSAVKVGADTAFNALDTPFRSTIDTVTSGMTWDKAWEKQGGWDSLFTNVGIGLVGSAGGEIFDGVKLNKASKILNSDDIFDSLDEVTSKELKDALLYAQQTGKINLSKMDEVIRDKIIKSIKEMDLAQLSKKEMNEIFDEMSTLFSSKKFKNSTLEEQKAMVDKNLDDVIKGFDSKLQNTQLNEVFQEGIEKARKKINDKKLFNDVDDSLVNQVRSNLMDRHINGEIDLNKMTKKELKDYIDTETANIKNYLKSIIKNSNFNKNNLIEGIVETIPKDLDDLTKARMVYLKLNQSVTYSDQYFAMNTAKDLYKKELSEMYNKSFDISDLSSNSIICSNWSNIYSDLLQEVGIDPKKIEIVQLVQGTTAHRWVKMDLGDGKILFADATNNINGMTDLANSKLGNPTGGFIITTEEEYAKLKGIYGRDDLAFRAINSNKNETISKIDENIGYTNQQYMKDLEDVTNMYRQASSIPLDEKINIFKDLLESQEYTSLDVFSLSRQYAPQMLGSNTNVNLFIKGDKVITVIEIFEDNNNVKYLYKINDSNIYMTDNISNIIEGATKKI